MTSFVIPNFLAAIEPLGIQSDFPVLAKMLSKANIEEREAKNAYELISSLMGVPENTSVGVSAIMQFAETGQEPSINDRPSKWTCCASPVVVMPNRDHLDLAQIRGFEISLDEAQSFCDEFNDYFKEDGFYFSFDSVDRWYCHTDKGFAVSDLSPYYAEGKNIAEHIPQGKDGAMWRKIFNDIQLLLHHSATNQKRLQLGKPEFNSLWLWGGGALTPSYNVAANVGKILTNDLYSTGLALRGEVEVNTLSNSTIEKHTYYIAGIETIDWVEWDEKYFVPALRSLKQGIIKEIRFHLDMNRLFVLKKIDLYCFWKKDKSITDFIPRDHGGIV